VLVVLDADCIIAGTLAPSGACRDILDNWLAGAFEVALCPRLLEEVERALLHPRIAGRYNIPANDARLWVRRLRSDGCMYKDPQNAPRVVPDDPNDDYLIALARLTGATALVSRDRHLKKVDNSAFDFSLLKPQDFRRTLDPS
jgi:predicted nucleic acid-binding protein